MKHIIKEVTFDAGMSATNKLIRFLREYNQLVLSVKIRYTYSTLIFTNFKAIVTSEPIVAKQQAEPRPRRYKLILNSIVKALRK